MLCFDKILKNDKELYDSMMRELDRQQNNIELIASENIVSEAVMEAMGSHLTNKYAEGYPGKRYYGGCIFVDEVEELARQRAKELFGADHANVQPHSGAQANIAVYFSLLQPGDTIMGMDLSHGGHLTHGSPVNISGKYFNFVPYGVNLETEVIDYEDVARIADTVHPKLIVAGASAYPRKIDFKRLRDISDSVNALLMVDMAHIAGLVAAGYHESPVPYADIVTTTTHKTLRGPRGGMILCKEEYQKQIDKGIFPGTQGGPLMHIIAAKALCLKEAMQDEFKEYQKQIIENAQVLASELMANGQTLVSNGTDNHLMLLNSMAKGKTGKEIEALLDSAHITANKNTIPNETLSPFVTSGLRIGTPAVTSRGMKENEMKIIASCISDLLNRGEDAIASSLECVKDLCGRFPIYK